MVFERNLRLIFLLIIGIFLLNVVSAQSCSVVQRSSCTDSVVMGFSSLTNAHGELASSGNYDYVLCCDFGSDTTCDGANKILGLVSSTNAHAEIPSLDNYQYDVCYENLACVQRTDLCSSGEIEMFSLSADTNAHLGSFDFYSTKICCAETVLPSVCGNGVLEAGEQCDDGNLINGDGCSSVCQTEPAQSVCGDGILNLGNEQCDDGNLLNGDGCSSTCSIESHDNEDEDEDDEIDREEKCNPFWACTGWSECVDDFKTRICKDLNHCDTFRSKPAETTFCEDDTLELGFIGGATISLGAEKTTEKNFGQIILWGLIIAIVILLLIMIVRMIKR